MQLFGDVGQCQQQLHQQNIPLTNTCLCVSSHVPVYRVCLLLSTTNISLWTFAEWIDNLQFIPRGIESDNQWDTVQIQQ